MPTALYRRYRPDTFDEVIGQDHVTGPLKAALANQRVNHAYLFSGPRGCGKTTSARILARCLNCAQGPTATPCGECESCRDLATGGPGSLDVVEIDAASHNGVDDARDLRERAVYAPARDRYKVFILDEAHMVTPQGFNALLKLVEEPPEHVKFVFATTEPEKVIGTIRSRTHHYPFRLVPPEIMTNYLEELCQREDVPVGKGVLPLVVRAGGGSVRDSLSVLDQLMAGAGAEGIDYPTAVALLGYTPESLLGDIVDAFAAGDGAAVYRVVDRVIESGQDPRRFVEDLLERFRDLIVVGTAPAQAAALLPEAPADHVERLVQQAQTMGPAELSRAADLLNAGLTEMTGATSPRLQLELMCARILLPSVDDARRGVLSRLDRMERRVGMSAAGAVPGGIPGAAGQDNSAASPAGGNEQPAAEVPAESAAASAGGGMGSAGADPAGAASRDSSDAAPPQSAGTAGASGAHYDDDLDAMADFAASAESMLDDDPAGAHQQQPQGSQPDGSTTAGNDEAANSAASQPEHNRQESAARESGQPAAPHGRNEQQADTAQPAPDDAQPRSAERSSAGPKTGGQAQGTAQAASAAPRQEGAPAGGATPDADAEPGSSGQEIDAIRRAWPNILDALGQRSRLARAIVSSNAVPQAFVDGALLLGFNNDSSAAGFNRNANDQKLAEALDEVLGIRAAVKVGDVGHGIEIPGQASTQNAPAQRRDQRRPSQQEFDAVVGKRAQDQETTDRDRYWQAPPESGPFSDNGDGDDDAEGDRRPHQLDAPDAPGTDRMRGHNEDDTGSRERSAQDRGAAGFGIPEESEAAQEDMPRAPEDYEEPYPLQDGTGSDQGDDPDAGEAREDPGSGDSGFGNPSNSDPAPVGHALADSVTDETVDAWSDVDADEVADADAPAQSAEDAAAAPAQSAGDAAAAQPMATTAAGWGAVDMPGVVVPPPADIDEPAGDESTDFSTDESAASLTDAPTDTPPEDAGPHGDHGHQGESTPEPPAEYDELDFLGAYADPTIAFTENEGFTPTVSQPQRSVADGIAARRAAQGEQAAMPTDASAAGEPANAEAQRSGWSAAERNGESAPRVADPAENYVDYDTAGDPEIAEAPEFGVPVVERLLGGQVLEEYEE